MAAEVLLEGLGVDLEGRKLARVSLDDAEDVGVMSSVSFQYVSYHFWRTSTSRRTWMFNSTLFVRPGTVKLLDPTRADEPMTAALACVMYAFAWNFSLV